MFFLSRFFCCFLVFFFSSHPSFSDIGLYSTAPPGTKYVSKTRVSCARLLRSLPSRALDKGLHVVVDEVYASSVYAEGASSFVSSLAMEASLPAACETRLHLVYGLSKDFCASGYRMGVLRTRNKVRRRGPGTGDGGRGTGDGGRGTGVECTTVKWELVCVCVCVCVCA